MWGCQPTAATRILAGSATLSHARFPTWTDVCVKPW